MPHHDRNVCFCFVLVIHNLSDKFNLFRYSDSIYVYTYKHKSNQSRVKLAENKLQLLP